mmetsp:Transcript_41558/g.137718  ORF Transcript_41558/g.137718 Transcript_41558/m.137718 type:complete len:224 (-) Transcript_41558:272-943(-)
MKSSPFVRKRRLGSGIVIICTPPKPMVHATAKEAQTRKTKAKCTSLASTGSAWSRMSFARWKEEVIMKRLAITTKPLRSIDSTKSSMARAPKIVDTTAMHSPKTTTIRLPLLPFETCMILLNLARSSSMSTWASICASAWSRTDLAKESVEMSAKADEYMAKPASPVVSPSPTAVSRVWNEKAMAMANDITTWTNHALVPRSAITDAFIVGMEESRSASSRSR